MTDLNRARRIPWARILIEGVVIVGSILLAFALDAWWDEREFDRVIDEDLASLETEVSQNLAELRATQDVQGRIVDAANALVGILDEDRGSTVMAPDTLVWWVLFQNPTFDPSFGGVEALTASGRLAAIEDPALRLEIAKLRGRWVDLAEEQVVARQMVVDQIYTMLGAGGVDLAPFRVLMRESVTPRPSLGTGIQPTPTTGKVEIPNSPEFRFAIGMRALWYESSNQEFAGVEQAVDSTLAMIRAYQAGRE